jgi:hypothetical protein
VVRLRARTESWTHEEFLVAVLEREVAGRESHGGEGRIRAARLLGRKSLEEFDFDQARGLRRELIAHLGTLDFITSRDNPGHRRLSRTRRHRIARPIVTGISMESPRQSMVSGYREEARSRPRTLCVTRQEGCPLWTMRPQPRVKGSLSARGEHMATMRTPIAFR